MAYRITVRARQDIGEIVAYSRHHHGADSAKRYEQLLLAAMDDVASKPTRPGSRAATQRPGVRVYQISLSHIRMEPGQKVKNAAHKLVYSIAADGIVEILAVVGSSYPADRVLPI